MISILVPIYKVEAYIERCIASIIGQTCTEWELILIDDCSPDQSMVKAQQLLDEYHVDPTRYTILTHSTNRGLAAARLTALQHAHGEYVWQIDSDDYLAENAVELLTQKIQATHADLICMDRWRQIGRTQWSQHTMWSGDPMEETSLILSGKAAPNIWCYLIKRSLYEDYHIMPIEGLNFGEDYLVTPLLAYHSKHITHMDQSVYYYCDNSSSLTHNISLECIEQLKTILNYHAQYFMDVPNLKQALDSGVWRKKMELYMHVPRRLYAQINQYPDRDFNADGLDQWQRYGAYMATHKMWHMLWIYSVCFQSLLHWKLKHHYSNTEVK